MGGASRAYRELAEIRESGAASPLSRRADAERLEALAQALLSPPRDCLPDRPRRETYLRLAAYGVEAALRRRLSHAHNGADQALARAFTHGDIRLDSAQRDRVAASLIAVDARLPQDADDFAAPTRLVEACLGFVAAALHGEARRRFNEDRETTLAGASLSAMPEAARAFAEAAGEMRAAETLLAARTPDEEMCETLLGELLDARRPAMFLLAFARCADLDAATARRVLDDRTCEPLAIACRAAGLSRAAFARIGFTLRKGADERVAAVYALDHYARLSPQIARRVAACWREERVRLARALPNGFTGYHQMMNAG